MRKLFTVAFIIIVVQLLVSPGFADMYKWVDKNGVVHYSDTPPATEEKGIETLETSQYTPPARKSDAATSQADGKASPQANPKNTAIIKKSLLDKYADKVVIFTKSWCPHSKKAIAFLKSKRIRFEHHDIEKNPEAVEKMKALGGPGGVPYALLKGTPVIGFTEGLYKQALDLR